MISTMRLIVLVCVVLTFGCRRSEDPPIFEGEFIVHTTADAPGRTGLHDDTKEGTIGLGKDVDRIAGYVLSSDKYWETFLTENPEYSVDEVEELRSRVQLGNSTVFRIDGEYFVKWTLTIEGGDRETFEAICTSYHLHRSGNRGALEFLQTRRGELLADLRELEESYQNQPTSSLAQQIEIQRANVAQLEARIDQVLIGEPSRRPGSLALHLMD